MDEKKVTVLSLLLIAFVLLAGCGNSETSQAKTKTIGYINSNFNDIFQNLVQSAAEEYINSQPGYTIESFDSQEDVVRQKDAVDALIAKQVSALIVVPVDTSAMSSITKEANAAGIPLVYVNRNPYADAPLPENTYYVGSQEIIGGRMQMEKMGELLNGQGSIAILMGKLDNEGALMRTKGVEEVIAEKYPDIKVLDKQTGNWQRDQGVNLTENWLTAFGGELTGIVSNNDGMALGAIRALKAAGRQDVVVIGLDAITDALVAVEAGDMAATVLQDATGQGKGAAEIAVSILEGKNPEQLRWIPFVLVDETNLAEYKK